MSLLEADARKSERSNVAYMLRGFAMQTLRNNQYNPNDTAIRSRMVLECSQYVENNYSVVE